MIVHFAIRLFVVLNGKRELVICEDQLLIWSDLKVDCKDSEYRKIGNKNIVLEQNPVEYFKYQNV